MKIAESEDNSILIGVILYSIVNAISFLFSGVLTWLIWKMSDYQSNLYMRLAMYMAILQLIFDFTGFLFFYNTDVIFYQPEYAWVDVVRVFCCDTSFFLSCILMYMSYYLIKYREIFLLQRWSKQWWIIFALMLAPQSIYIIMILVGVYSDPSNYSATDKNNYLHKVTEVGFYIQTYLRVLYCAINIILYHMSFTILRERRKVNISRGIIDLTRQEIASTVVLRRLGLYPMFQVFGNVFYLLYLSLYGYTFHNQFTFSSDPARYMLQLFANILLVSVPMGECVAFMTLQPGAWEFIKSNTYDYFCNLLNRNTSDNSSNSDYLSSAFDEYRDSLAIENDKESKSTPLDIRIKNEDIHLCRDAIIKEIILRHDSRESENPLFALKKRKSSPELLHSDQDNQFTTFQKRTTNPDAMVASVPSPITTLKVQKRATNPNEI